MLCTGVIVVLESFMSVSCAVTLVGTELLQVLHVCSISFRCILFSSPKQPHKNWGVGVIPFYLHKSRIVGFLGGLFSKK